MLWQPAVASHITSELYYHASSSYSPFSSFAVISSFPITNIIDDNEVIKAMFFSKNYPISLFFPIDLNGIIFFEFHHSDPI